MSFSSESISLTKTISKPIKKQFGIYFTPPECVQKAIDILKVNKLLKKTTQILEPSCGSGEFIRLLQADNPKVNITGIELNESIYNTISGSFKSHKNICIKRNDYLQEPERKKYDLIIGNPPFNVLKKANIDSKYLPMLDGRPNIFNLFILKSFNMIKKGGVICFVLPSTFLNSSYYSKTRRYIYDNFRIISIIECKGKYLETTQPTIMMIIQQNQDTSNRDRNGPYSNINNDGSIVLNSPEIITEIKRLTRGATTLKELGFKVNVGNIVWNQVKPSLKDDSTKTRLIYSSDIKDKTVIMSDFTGTEKKNYIDSGMLKDKSPFKKPMLVINRGYGKGKYKFNYAYVDGSYEYYVENHLLCITSVNDDMDTGELQRMYQKIMKSLDDERTSQFISLYFTNDAISTTELTSVLPIYDSLPIVSPVDKVVEHLTSQQIDGVSRDDMNRIVMHLSTLRGDKMT